RSLHDALPISILYGIPTVQPAVAGARQHPGQPVDATSLAARPRRAGLAAGPGAGRQRDGLAGRQSEPGGGHIGHAAVLDDGHSAGVRPARLSQPLARPPARAWHAMKADPPRRQRARAEPVAEPMLLHHGLVGAVLGLPLALLLSGCLNLMLGLGQ